MDHHLMLAVAEGVGPALVPALLDPGIKPESLLSGRDRPPLPRAVRARLEDPDLAQLARAWCERAGQLGQTVLTPADDRYPRRLAPLPLRPNALFARGAPECLAADQPAVAVVGSRTPTPYGLAAAEAFAMALARSGFAIWSGLARGIDAIAHRAALQAGTPTVAVLAGGLDRVYPAEHRALAEEICSHGGLLLSESPPGRRALRGHFPRRNRILCAAQAVLVVEAGRASGTLHTARHAADAGIDVFAVPGPYGSPRSAGCHDLIADGAQIAASPADLVHRLGADAALRGDATPSGEPLGGDAQAILQVVASGPRPADLVAREAGLAPAAFFATVHRLVAAGLLTELPGDLLAPRGPG